MIHWQGRVQITTPIPDCYLDDAARLWWRAFAPPMNWRRPPFRTTHGIAAIDEGVVQGVAGLRDEQGGFVVDGNRGLIRPEAWLTGLAFRPAPPTGDLVIDGICAVRRRSGIGRALLDAASGIARSAGRPGLRAEVALNNPVALHFYKALGFVPIGSGRYGWPWTGTVAVLHRPV